MLGESFGGMIAIHSMLREQQNNAVADGYIMTGPVIILRQEMLPPKIIVAIAKFWPCSSQS